MSEQERLTEVAALLMEYDRKLAEADAIRKRLKTVINHESSSTRKKTTRRPQDIIREVLQ